MASTIVCRYGITSTNEEITDAIRDNLSPEAVAIIVAYLQPATSTDKDANREVAWFRDQLGAILGSQFNIIADSIGL